MNISRFTSRVIEIGTFLTLGAIIAATTCGSTVSAQSSSYYPPITPAKGTNQRYVVTYDAESEATVVGEFQYTNYTKSSIESVTITLPGTNITLLRAVQDYTVDKQETYCKERHPDGSCLITDTHTVPEYKSAVLEPTKTDAAESATLTVTLEGKIEPNKSSTIYISYKATGLVTQKNGLYSYAFKTAQINTPLDRVDVAIYTEPSLYLKGAAKGSVDYTPNLAEGLTLYTTDQALKSPFSGQISRAIDDQTAVHRYTTSLDANESFTVKGTYARSWWLLYYPYLLATVLGLLILFGIIMSGERSLSKKEMEKS